MSDWDELATIEARRRERIDGDWCALYADELFRQGAAWQRTQLDKKISDMPERLRDPSALAKFTIENEWALASETDPSGRADWHETLHRVFDAWDADTPEDIVSTIAAAIRLDRELRGFREEGERIPHAPLSLKDLEAAWEAAEQADECRKGDVMIVRFSRGEYTILEAEGVLQLATTARVLSRAPKREPWADLADVLRTGNGELIGEHHTITEVAKALHERGVRVVGGDGDE